MPTLYFVRYGIHGHIGVFESRLGVAFANGSKVVCQTERGVEAGIALSEADSLANARDDGQFPKGAILRPFTFNDELLAERLERYQGKAFEACSKILGERGISTPLVDVEQLHDGENLFFYFLGETDEQLESLIDELAQSYGRKIRFRQFAEKLANGCGPSCGTGESKCSSTGCSSCGLSGKCSNSAAAT